MLHRRVARIGQMQAAADVGAEQARRAAVLELIQQRSAVVGGACGVGEHLRAGSAAAAVAGIEFDHFAARARAPARRAARPPTCTTLRWVQGRCRAMRSWQFAKPQRVGARGEARDGILRLRDAGQRVRDGFVATAGQGQHGAGLRKRAADSQRRKVIADVAGAGVRMQAAAAGLRRAGCSTATPAPRRAGPPRCAGCFHRAGQCSRRTGRRRCPAWLRCGLWRREALRYAVAAAGAASALRQPGMDASIQPQQPHAAICGRAAQPLRDALLPASAASVALAGTRARISNSP